MEDETLVIRDEMDASDVEKWDSMNHVKLLVSVEKFYGVKFRNAEMARLQTIGDLKRLIAKHKPSLVA